MPWKPGSKDAGKVYEALREQGVRKGQGGEDRRLEDRPAARQGGAEEGQAGMLEKAEASELIEIQWEDGSTSGPAKMVKLFGATDYNAVIVGAKAREKRINLDSLTDEEIRSVDEAVRWRPWVDA